MAKKIYIIIATTILTVFFSCKYKHEISNTSPHCNSLNNVLLDSLKLNFLKDEYTLLNDSLNYSVLIKSFKNIKIGIISIGEQSLCLYESKDEKWIKIDSSSCGNYITNFNFLDINKDKKIDFIVNGRQDGWGNFATYVYLNNNNTFKYFPNLSLNSLQYDKKLNKFITSVKGSNYAYKNKELYEFKDNNFELIKGAEINPDNSDNNVIKFYKIEKDKKVNYLTLKDTNSNISVFDTAIYK